MTAIAKTTASAMLLAGGVFLATAFAGIAADAAAGAAQAQVRTGGYPPANIMLVQNNRQARPMSPVARSPVPGYGGGPVVNSPVPGGPGFGPGPGFGGDWYGCAAARVHGSFNVRVCANGSYRVIGGGLFCSGRLYHRVGRGGLRISLGRTRCNQGTDWSGGTFVCRGFYGGPLNGANCHYIVSSEARYNGWQNEGVYFQ